jgi:hypothetical protein
VWSFIVEGPEVFSDDLAVFSGGLSDDRGWKFGPAVLAYSPGGVPVVITEMVTKKYCLDQEIEYAPLAGAFYYRVERLPEDPSGQVSNGLVQVRGMKLPEIAPSRTEFEFIHVSLSRDEVDQWIREIRKSGIKKSYDGVDYMIPDLSAETAK